MVGFSKFTQTGVKKQTRFFDSSERAAPGREVRRTHLAERPIHVAAAADGQSARSHPRL
jgi:hypothetical protein